MKQDVGETHEVSHMERWRCARTDSDLEAFAAFQQSLEETVLTWLHAHPGREAACRMHSEEHFVALAFERLRQAVVQRQVTCETLSGVLLYLRMSLNGAILEMLRVSSRPGGPWPDGEDRPDSSQVWQKLQALLESEREQRLASLLYHCGLSPADIVRACPHDWNDVQEVARLRRRIFLLFLQGLADHSPSIISLERG